VSVAANRERAGRASAIQTGLATLGVRNDGLGAWLTRSLSRIVDPTRDRPAQRVTTAGSWTLTGPRARRSTMTGAAPRLSLPSKRSSAPVAGSIQTTVRSL
jgi:hypothetical protein